MVLSSRTVRRVGGLLAVGVAAIAVACETPIAPSYVLDSPRILAIRSTPVDLQPASQVTLDALVYAPPGSPAPTYQWSWCASVGATLQCATTAAELTTILDPYGVYGVSIDYALGSGSTATFAYPVSPSLIQAACVRAPTIDDGGEDGGDAGDGGEDAGDDAGLGDDGGFAIVLDGGVVARLGCTGDALTVYVLLTVTVGEKTMQSVQDLTIDIDASTAINTNPTIVGVAPFTSATPSDAGALANPGEDADGGVEDAGVGSVVGGATDIAADVPAAATDLYVRTTGGTFIDGSFEPGTTTTCVPAEAGSDAAAGDAGGSAGEASEDAGTIDDGGATVCTLVGPEVYESLSLAWYVTGGEIESPTTTLRSVPQGTPQDWSAALQNRWTLPSSATNEIIVVVRDNRGGVGWLVQSVKTP